MATPILSPQESLLPTAQNPRRLQRILLPDTPPKPISAMTPAEKDKFVREVVTQIAAAKKKADEGK
jgi:hypothetical protein